MIQQWNIKSSHRQPTTHQYNASVEGLNKLPRRGLIQSNSDTRGPTSATRRISRAAVKPTQCREASADVVAHVKSTLHHHLPPTLMITLSVDPSSVPIEETSQEHLAGSAELLRANSADNCSVDSIEPEQPLADTSTPTVHVDTPYRTAPLTWSNGSVTNSRNEPILTF